MRQVRMHAWPLNLSMGELLALLLQYPISKYHAQIWCPGFAGHTGLSVRVLHAVHELFSSLLRIEAGGSYTCKFASRIMCQHRTSGPFMRYVPSLQTPDMHVFRSLKYSGDCSSKFCRFMWCWCIPTTKLLCKQQTISSGHQSIPEGAVLN